MNKAFKGNQRPLLVQYADDLVVLHPDLTVIQASQQILNEWLSGMGLELKPSKTRITHTLETIDGNVGFDFLGYSIRQYRVGKTHSKQGFKTFIKPSKTAQIRHSQRLRQIVRGHRSATQAQLIAHLNPVIRGWSNYYSTVCSKAVFSAMDCQLYHKLLHRHCHDQLHRSLRDKHRTVEEPCEATSLMHGSEDQRSG